MARVVVIPGVGPRKVATRRAQLKGIAKNRRDYDRRRRLNPDSPTTLAYKRLIRMDPCIVCGRRPAEGQVQDVDHIVPLLSGGEDDWTNMAAACKRCNRGRKDTPLLLHLLRGRR